MLIIQLHLVHLSYPSAEHLPPDPSAHLQSYSSQEQTLCAEKIALKYTVKKI